MFMFKNVKHISKRILDPDLHKLEPPKRTFNRAHQPKTHKKDQQKSKRNLQIGHKQQH